MHRNRILSVVLAIIVLTGLMSFIPSTQAYDVCQQYHTVQTGENLFRISLRYSTTVTTLASLNQLASTNTIYAGQRLCVSGTAGSPIPAPSTQTTYTVLRGDTLYSIARRFNVSAAVLAQANGITNNNLIYVGQVLRIPSLATNNDVVIPTPPLYAMALVNVNLRSGPGFNFAVEGQMRAGETAYINGTSMDRQWWRVTCVVDASGNCWVSANPALIQAIGLPQ